MDYFKCVIKYEEKSVKILIDGDKQIINFPLFIEWAYSEGEIISEELKEYFEFHLNRPLERKSFGRFMQFYVEWANKPYWNTQESINLLIDNDPKDICGKAIPAINNRGNKYKSEITEEIFRALHAGHIKLISPQYTYQLDDAFYPSNIINWANNNLLGVKNRGYCIPALLLDAIERHAKEYVNNVIVKRKQRKGRPKGSGAKDDTTALDKICYVRAEYKSKHGQEMPIQSACNVVANELNITENCLNSTIERWRRKFRELSSGQ